MTGVQAPDDFHLTRRQALTLVLAGGGALLLAGASAPANAGSSKVSQKAVAYRNRPNGTARCDNCALWQPPASCKVVAGVISPAGWCTIYARKA